MVLRWVEVTDMSLRRPIIAVILGVVYILATLFVALSIVYSRNAVLSNAFYFASVPLVGLPPIILISISSTVVFEYYGAVTIRRGWHKRVYTHLDVSVCRAEDMLVVKYPGGEVRIKTDEKRIKGVEEVLGTQIPSCG